MKICLVSPPTTIQDKDIAESEAVRQRAQLAPLGILTLAAILERGGVEPNFVDINALYYEYLDKYPGCCNQDEFVEFVVQSILPLGCDCFGFGTICSSYPLTLQVSKRLRCVDPCSTIVLGGPQASVVDLKTIETFPWIDFIVRGEADNSFPRLIDALKTQQPVSDVLGITERINGKGVRHQSAPLISDLDSIPIPAFHLYEELSNALNISLEFGRGCPYGCSFCSTNDFFRRRSRLKSPNVVIKQMAELQTRYPKAAFLLIHDMFTVDRKRVIEFCKELIESELSFSWGCSARTDCVDHELLEIMSQAGCRGIFFGVETGSAKLQTSINKRLDLSEAADRIKKSSELDLWVTVSLLTGFPDEDRDDFSQTVNFFVDSLRNESAIPQIEILAPLADTQIFNEYRNQLYLDEIISGISFNGSRRSTVEREMVAANPEIFPNFYAVPTQLDRGWVKHSVEFLMHLSRLYRWLLVGLHQDSGDILDVFDDWVIWRERSQGIASLRSGCDASYYGSNDFREGFLRFVRDFFIPVRARAPHSISALLEFYCSFPIVHGRNREFENEDLSLRAVGDVGIDESSIPRFAAELRITDMDVDFAHVMQALKGKTRLSEVPARPVKLASRKTKDSWEPVKQLSSASSTLLMLCDGRKSIREISKCVDHMNIDTSGIDSLKYCLFGFEQMRRDRLISL